jgi:hypothetical protein
LLVLSSFLSHILATALGFPAARNELANFCYSKRALPQPMILCIILVPIFWKIFVQVWLTHFDSGASVVPTSTIYCCYYRLQETKIYKLAATSNGIIFIQSLTENFPVVFDLKHATDRQTLPFLYEFFSRISYKGRIRNWSTIMYVPGKQWGDVLSPNKRTNGQKYILNQFRYKLPLIKSSKIFSSNGQYAGKVNQVSL